MKRWMVMLWLLCVGVAHAAGPRWVAGPQWSGVGTPMTWYTNDVRYWVDAGPLSASVDHDAAVALVDAAASVWNLPTVSMTLKNGGALNEDVSSSNVYLGANGPVWPADVLSSNYTSKAIAVVFDTDGSITDMLLGGGASDPANCRTNAVTESVDLFIQPGRIAHALVIVNGRCSGPAPEQQLQLQYQLMRVFGRVLGVGWSQTNDNVFTGMPAPTYQQQMHWPIMHPIDIVCGPYTYQCLPQPFTLRDDDTAAVRLLYGGTLLTGATLGTGTLQFATGEGMSGLNVTVVREAGGLRDAYQDVSGVSGYLYQNEPGNPVTGKATNPQGSAQASWQGFFQMFGVPVPAGYVWMNMHFNVEALNPLYVGSYAVGPYRQGTAMPSGVLPSFTATFVAATTGKRWPNMVMVNAANGCNTGNDGSENAPADVSADGAWSGELCGVGHSAWSSVNVRAGRTATWEVTALDESWRATKQKAMPVLGVWHGADATGTLPTMAKVSSAFNAATTGMTQLKVAFDATERVRFAVSDQRGDGRPDYLYRARLLYADTVLPAQLSASGGAIRIVGMGFRAGNTVMIGGVAAAVTSVSLTEIDAIAPAGSGSADVTVIDLATGGSTSIAGGLSYVGGAADVVSWVSGAPAAANVGADVPLVVKVVSASGKPSAYAAVTFSLTSGNGVVGVCSLAACTVATDASGVAQVMVRANAAGAVTAQAAVKSGSSVTTSFAAMSTVRVLSFVRPTEYVASGAGTVFAPAVALTANGAAASGQAVAWSSGNPRVTLNVNASVTGVDGLSAVGAGGSLRDGETAAIQACAWSTVCATQTVVGVAAASLGVAVVSGGGQSVGMSGSLGAVVMRVVDGAGHPVAGAAVQVYQVVSGWQPPCATSGRCAVAPVYGKSSVSLVSDDDGLVTVTPLQYADAAAVTKMTATAGTQGAVTISLQKTP